jgi:hypothetical protein
VAVVGAVDIAVGTTVNPSVVVTQAAVGSPVIDITASATATPTVVVVAVVIPEPRALARLVILDGSPLMIIRLDPVRTIDRGDEERGLDRVAVIARSIKRSQP